MTEADVDAIDRIQQATVPDSASGWAARDYLHLDAWVAATGPAVRGFLVARPIFEEEFELLNMAVAPEQRRRGYARALLEHVIAVRPGSWFLEVRESNLAAQALYESLGFHRCGRRHDYYRSPSEDAIEMSKHS